MTSVWPALCPPWKRTTMSACSDSQSTTFPLPSSPHWEPTTTTLAMSYLFQSEPKPEINRESTDICPPFAPRVRDNGSGPIKQGGRFARDPLRSQLSNWFFRHIVALQHRR